MQSNPLWPSRQERTAMPLTDPFHAHTPGLESPPQGLLDVSPSDTADLPSLLRGFMVRTSGDVAVVMFDGSEGVIPMVQPGSQIVARIRRVRATGTTATGIVGFL